MVSGVIFVRRAGYGNSLIVIVAHPADRGDVQNLRWRGQDFLQVRR